MPIQVELPNSQYRREERGGGGRGEGKKKKSATLHKNKREKHVGPPIITSSTGNLTTRPHITGHGNGTRGTSKLNLALCDRSTTTNTSFVTTKAAGKQALLTKKGGEKEREANKKGHKLNQTRLRRNASFPALFETGGQGISKVKHSHALVFTQPCTKRTTTNSKTKGYKEGRKNKQQQQQQRLGNLERATIFSSASAGGGPQHSGGHDRHDWWSARRLRLLVGRPLLGVLLGELLGVLEELLAVLAVLLGQIGTQRVLGLGVVD